MANRARSYATTVTATSTGTVAPPATPTQIPGPVHCPQGQTLDPVSMTCITTHPPVVSPTSPPGTPGVPVVPTTVPPTHNNPPGPVVHTPRGPEVVVEGRPQQGNCWRGGDGIWFYTDFDDQGVLSHIPGSNCSDCKQQFCSSFQGLHSHLGCQHPPHPVGSGSGGRGDMGHDSQGRIIIITSFGNIVVIQGSPNPGNCWRGGDGFQYFTDFDDDGRVVHFRGSDCNRIRAGFCTIYGGRHAHISCNNFRGRFEPEETNVTNNFITNTTTAAAPAPAAIGTAVDAVAPAAGLLGNISPQTLLIGGVAILAVVMMVGMKH
jgi:hypothetical protein